MYGTELGIAQQQQLQNPASKEKGVIRRRGSSSTKAGGGGGTAKALEDAVGPAEDDTSKLAAVGRQQTWTAGSLPSDSASGRVSHAVNYSTCPDTPS